jgi:hypothetical protein
LHLEKAHHGLTCSAAESDFKFRNCWYVAQDEQAQRAAVLRGRAAELKLWSKWHDLPQDQVDDMFRWLSLSYDSMFVTVHVAASCNFMVLLQGSLPIQTTWAAATSP